MLLELNVIGVENQEQMAAIEEVGMETVGINDLEEMIEEVEIENLEEINLKIKLEMEIGLAKVVGIIISHSEPNVIDVEKRNPVVIQALEEKEVIVEDRTIDHNEDLEIMENDDKIQGVVSIVQITEGILEEVVAQTTLEIEIDVD